MTRRFPAPIHAALCGLILSTAAAAAVPEGVEGQIDELFAAWDTTTSAGCAVGVFRGGEIAYARGYGMANLEYGIALSPRSVFRVASMSKQFTAAAIALLVEEGAVDLDHDLRTYFPELGEYARDVTPRHLVHHTSGLRDYLELADLAGLGESYSAAEALELVARQRRLNYEPGERFLYSNTNYFLLALLVERLTGSSFTDWTAEHLFRPLGMTSTHFHDDHTHLVRNRADGYAVDGDRLRIEMTTLDVVGDGGLYSSIEDLLLWDRNFYDNRLGRKRPELIAEILTTGELNSGARLDYAFGLDVCDHRGLRIVSHSGAFAGFRTEMVRFPAHELSVAVLCNLAQVNPVPLARQVAELYLDAEMTPKDSLEKTASVTVPARQLSQLEGHYWNAAASEARRVYVAVGKLYWDLGTDGSELLPLGFGRFRMLGVSADVELRFEPAGDVRPDRLVVSLDHGRWGTYVPFAKRDVSPRELAAYAGTYTSDELGVSYALAIHDGRLTLGIPRFPEPPPLEPQFDETFTVQRIGAVRFRRGGDGRVTGFVLDGERARGLEFVREQLR